jgi:hypothetical protein
MANEVYSGRDGIVKISTAAAGAGVLTDISMQVADLAIDATTEEITYTTLGRPKRVKLAGYAEETWTITGPYNAESEAFWRPQTVGTAGTNRTYEVRPTGATGATWAGTLNVISFESTGINPDNVEEFEAKVGVNTKTVTPGTLLAAAEAERA